MATYGLHFQLVSWDKAVILTLWSLGLHSWWGIIYVPIALRHGMPSREYTKKEWMFCYILVLVSQHPILVIITCTHFYLIWGYVIEASAWYKLQIQLVLSTPSGKELVSCCTPSKLFPLGKQALVKVSLHHNMSIYIVGVKARSVYKVQVHRLLKDRKHGNVLAVQSGVFNF